MKRWADLEQESPHIAAVGQSLIYPIKVGLGYLATIRKDGGPRLHPVCPVIVNGGIYVFIGNHSPKLHDLLRDGRYALHSFPRPDLDDEFYLSGRAAVEPNQDVRHLVYATYTATGAFTTDDTLFELFLERALIAEYEARPSWPPKYTIWNTGA